MTSFNGIIALSRQQSIFHLPAKQSCLRPMLAPRQGKSSVDRTALLEVKMTAKGSKKYPLMASYHPDRKSYCSGLCNLWKPWRKEKAVC